MKPSYHYPSMLAILSEWSLASYQGRGVRMAAPRPATRLSGLAEGSVTALWCVCGDQDGGTQNWDTHISEPQGSCCPKVQACSSVSWRWFLSGRSPGTESKGLDIWLLPTTLLRGLAWASIGTPQLHGSLRPSASSARCALSAPAQFTFCAF